MNLTRASLRLLHRTALHEAGHAVALWQAWLDVPVLDRPPAPWHRVEANHLGYGLTVQHPALRLTPWAMVIVKLSGPLAEDGATRKRLYDRDAWCPSDHGGGGDRDLDYVETWADEQGVPDAVVRVASEQAAYLLWRHREAVLTIARMVERAGEITWDDVQLSQQDQSA